jgi:hypothetical protein
LPERVQALVWQVATEFPASRTIYMKLNLFQEVVINCDFPEFKIAAGDIAILNDYVVDRSGEEGCVLEIYSNPISFTRK